MAANYNYYHIDIADIWQFERLLFLKDKSSFELSQKIIDKAEALIIEDGEASFGINYRDSQDKNEREYYNRNQKQYAEACNTLKGRFQIEFFFNKGSCFQFDKTILVNRDNIDFDFWFALKLRQYDTKITKINDFLEYQLEKSFLRNSKNFSDFMELIIRQYQMEFLNDKIVDTVKEWIVPHGSKKQFSNKGNRKKFTNLKSFRLKEISTNPNVLKIGENRTRLKVVFENLKSNDFISKENAFDNFISIFDKGEVKKKKRIIWSGSNVELQWFVKYLVYESQIVEDPKNDIWLVTIHCFVGEDQKEYTIPQLRDAKGKKLERQKLLKTILSEM
ncbi:hypothetical protein [Winogradskyella sp.]|uniref:hypothetical protein n=1 Tax=Winogradskyella sp. TaxID=1883156 RepID=UPI003513C1AB